jgi:invasion protein IalB
MFRSALRSWSGIMMLAAPLLCVCLHAVAAAEVLRLQADDWVTECDTAHETSNDDCSIIGVFRDRSRQGIAGSFSLLADLRNKQLAVVGDPPPTLSRLQVDKNAPVQCNGAPYCIFSGSDAEIVIRQLQTGSLIFIDVFTAKGPLKFSLSTKGYRAGIAKIQAQGYAVPKN